jgi:hypothetical protein
MEWCVYHDQGIIFLVIVQYTFKHELSWYLFVLQHMSMILVIYKNLDCEEDIIEINKKNIRG